MGRAKSKMELLNKEKVRNTTFQKRKNTVKKKVYELATLCGIKAVVIIYGPKQVTQQARSLEPEIFPDNRDEVLELINKYRGQSPEDRKDRTYLLSNFFQERNKNLQQDLNKLRKANIQSKYPTSASRFDNLPEKDLRKITDVLEKKIENAKGKLEHMKANYYRTNICSAYYLQQQQRMLTGMTIPMPMQVQQQRYPFVDHYQNETMVEFGNDFAGGASNNVYHANPSNDIYSYLPMANTVNTIPYINNLARAPPIYYGGDMQPHHIEYHPRGTGPTPHQVVATSHQADDHARFYEDRKWQATKF